MTSDKLLPCPFCGGEARIEIQGFGTKHPAYRVRCKNIAACASGLIEWFDTEAEARAAWNRREPDIVRCGECANWERHTAVDKEHGGCYSNGRQLPNKTTHQDHFCSYGQRRKAE
jgi:hypothetical protein